MGVGDRLEAGAFLDSQGVLHATLARSADARPEVVLEWLHPASGAVKARAPLAIPWERRSAFGPLILGIGQLWAVLLRGETGQREIGERDDYFQCRCRNRRCAR